MSKRTAVLAAKVWSEAWNRVGVLIRDPLF